MVSITICYLPDVLMPNVHYLSFIFRYNSTGDRLSITPDNLSPGRGLGGNMPSKSAPHSRSAIEVAINGISDGGQRSNGSYNSSTLPIRKHRNKQTSEERSKKVNDEVCLGFY